MKLLFNRSVMLNGTPTVIGQVYDVNHSLALELLHRHVAVPFTEAEPEEIKPALKPKQRKRKKEEYDGT